MLPRTGGTVRAGPAAWNASTASLRMCSFETPRPPFFCDGRAIVSEDVHQPKLIQGGADLLACGAGACILATAFKFPCTAHTITGYFQTT